MALREEIPPSLDVRLVQLCCAAWFRPNVFHSSLVYTVVNVRVLRGGTQDTFREREGS